MDLPSAKKEFEKKFHDKTKNRWSNRDQFQVVSGKYTLLHKDYGADADAATEESLGLFFRAASGIRDVSGDVSGDPDAMDRDDEGAGDDAIARARDSPSDPLLQHLVKLLRSIMSGFPAAGFDAGDAMPPVSALEYYETLMLFFERLGCSLGAMRCAHAALRHGGAPGGKSAVHPVGRQRPSCLAGLI